MASYRIAGVMLGVAAGTVGIDFRPCYNVVLTLLCYGDLLDRRGRSTISVDTISVSARRRPLLSLLLSCVCLHRQVA